MRVIASTIVFVLVSGWQGSQSRATLEIRTWSSRSDLVSGGDALIGVSQRGIKSPLPNEGSSSR